MTRLEKAISVCFVFFVFATIVFSVYMRSPALFTADDPYYHIYRASALWRGEEPNLPIYSSLRTKPVTFYLVYYWTMAPFTAGFDGTNYESLIIGSKIYHALLIALLYSTFFVITWKLLKNRNYALVAVFSLFATSGLFSFRAFLPRPHIISITVVLLAYYYCVYSKKKSLFVLNVISPFTYSVSFVSVIPGIVYSIIIKKWWPALLSCAGLIVGVLLRPDGFNYVYNGYALHLISLFRTSILGKAGPGEFKAGNFSLFNEPWIILYVLALGYVFISYLTYRKNGTSQHKWTNGQKFTLALSFLFYVPFMFIQRTIEYLLPFAIIFICMIWKEHIIFLISKFTDARLSERSDRAYRYLFALPQKFFIAVIPFKKILVVFLGMVLIVLFLQQVKYMSQIIDRQLDPGLFAPMARFLETHSQKGDIVAYQDFAIYNRLVFFNQYNHYVVGIDPIFTFGYDPKKYTAWYDLATNNISCDEKKCNLRNSGDVYGAIHDTLKARFFVFDSTYKSTNAHTVKNATTTRGLLENDSRFKRVFEFASFSGSSTVYELIN